MADAATHRRRVLVPRPATQSAALLLQLGQAGMQALPLPVIVIVPLTDACPPTARFDEVIFVSRNAVRHGAPLLQAAHATLPPQLAAVGPGTALALREAGYRDVLEPAEGAPAGGDGLLLNPAFAAERVRGHAMLIVRGVGGEETLARVLRERGASVEYLEVYRRSASPAAAGALRSLAATDADMVIIATSAGIVELLFEAAGDVARDWLCRQRFVAISPRVARTLSEYGVRHPATVARGTDDAALARAALYCVLAGPAGCRLPTVPGMHR